MNKIILLLLGITVFTFSFIFAAQTINQDMKKDDIEAVRRGNELSPFGVLEFLHWNHDWNSYKYSSDVELKKAILLMRQAGVGWVRMDFLWSDIEPNEGEFNFEKYDRIVDLLVSNGLHVLGILHYSTDWASSCGKWNCPPKDNKVFIKYVNEVILRYKSKVKHWELWNEPDSAIYWKEQDGLKTYCVLLKDVYLAAKKIDPDCKILNGGLANGLASINHLYENGAKDYFDILNIHHFQNPLHGSGAIKAVVSYPKLAYKIMKRNGDGNKKIWITEIGAPGVKLGLKVDNWWLGNNPNERKQAVWVKEVYTQLLKDEHVEKIFWAFFRDTKDHWNNGVDYFGLIRWGFSKKPSFRAYQECVESWMK